MSSGGLTTARRRFAIPLLRPARLPSVRTVGILAAVVLIVGLGWLWFRGSSFVRIRQVSITGISGPNANHIRQELTAQADSMTTMNLSVKKLEDSVSQYGVVLSISAHTHFPHAVSIAVAEQIPVADISAGGKLVVVDGAGKLLPRSTSSNEPLPSLTLKSVPLGSVVTAPGAQAALKVLRAAPYEFLAKVKSAGYDASNGVVLQLRNGPDLYFGPANELGLKWTAAMSVLADSSSNGADYIDVSDPRRPAAGVPVNGDSSTGSTS